MADDRYPLEEEIRAGMARWQIGAEAQIHEQAWRIDHAFQLAKWDFYGLDTQRDNPEAYRQAFDGAVHTMALRTDWLAQNPLEEVQARLEASRAAAEQALQQGRSTIPDYPEEEDYTEDYAGDDDTEADTWEPTMAPRGSGEYDLQEPMPMHAEARFDSTASLSSDPLEIDTDSADMGTSWREQLAALEARLDALTEQQLTLDLDHDQEQLQMELRHEQGGRGY